MSAINVPLCAEESYIDYMQMLSETICFWSPNSPIVDNDPKVLKACLRLGYKCPSVQRCECTPATAIIGPHAGKMPSSETIQYCEASYKQCEGRCMRHYGASALIRLKSPHTS